ncbi:MAG: hypothetical protein ACI4UH_04850 [Dorea sp.]
MEYLSLFETMLVTIGGADGPTAVFIAGPELQIGKEVLIASAVISLIIGLLGLKLFRVLSVFEGLGIGAAIGLVIASVAGVSGGAFLGVVIACAVVCAVLLAVFKRVGAFFIVFGFTAGALFVIFTHFSLEAMMFQIIALAVSLILAILAAIFIEPIVIIATSIFGGITAGTALFGIIGVDGVQWIGYLLCIVCIVVQSMLQSRKIGKKEKRFSEKYREEASMESEVERARMILDEEEGDEDNLDIEIDEIKLDEIDSSEK